MPDEKKQLRIDNPFLQTYLEYTINTESPKIMHVWSAISAASACMGRHLYMPFGIGDIYPNMFVLLVGPPGTRKSQAIKYASSLVAKHTNVRFAPDDTGGQRQGLITALEGDEPLDSADQDLDLLDNAFDVANVTDIGELNISIAKSIDRHHMFACASEFGTFMGEANANTTRFLNKIWDGEDYHYKLRNAQQVIRNPLMTIVGGTTTADIARILPADAIGQGFMSRWILVHAPNKSKRVAEPYLIKELGAQVADVFYKISRELEGPVERTPEARELSNAMYMSENVDIQDTRFVYYCERRHTHLLKLALVLCVTRGSMEIDVQDLQQADCILAFTEERMPEALGEFGLSPVGAAKQKMLEFLQAAKGPVGMSLLWQIMSRDMKQLDFRNAVADLINSNKLAEVQTNSGQAVVYKEEFLDEELNAKLGF